MKKKGWIGFLIGIAFGLLMVMPSFVHADVTIGTAETSMVDLEDVNLTTGRNAYVTGLGSVVTGDDAALWASVSGWSINVASGGMVRATSSGYYGVLFNSLSDGTGTFLNGTVTNYGTIGSISDTGIGLGSGWITNSGSIIGYDTAIDFNGAGTGTATVTNNVGGLIFSHDYESIHIGSVGTATVTNAGTIQSRQGDAIYIEDVVGEAKVTNNFGGFIQSHWGNGLDIYNVGTATVINSGTIQSDDDYDYYAALYIGSADTATVTNSGTIQAYGSAVYIEDTDTATVTNNVGGLLQSSDYNGIYMNNVGTATVNNSGTIQSYDPAIYIENTDVVTVTNNTGGLIQSSDDDGMYIGNVGTVTVTNSGTIRTTYDEYAGLNIEDVGKATVTNNAGGLIEGYDDGIHIDSADTVTVTNHGTITGTNYDGLHISDATTAIVDNYGTIQGAYEGLYIYDVGTATVTNKAGGTIIGDSYGVYVHGVDTATVTNSGTIQTSGDGVYIEYATDKATVTNNAGGFIQSSDGRGVVLYEIGSEDTAEVINSGIIQAYNEGVYIGYSDAAKVTNNAGGLIQSLNSYGIGIEYSYDVNVTNSGLIQGYIDGIGIQYVDGDVLVTNNTGGTIQGNNLAGVGIINVTGAAELTNNAGGTIQGNVFGVAIYNYDEDGTAKVTNSGTIQGDYLGVGLGYADTATVINNAGGTIQQIGTNGYGVGIVYVDTATVTNAGAISGYYDGVGMQYVYDAEVTNNTGGIIQGIGNGVGMRDVYDSATVENHGTIQAGNGSGVFIRAEGDGTAVSVDNSGTISSTGGDSMRIILHNANETASVINTATGVISGNGGIYLDVANSNSTGEIKNSGLITSNGDGIDVTGYGQKTITNYAGGIIYGDVYGIRGVNGPTTIFNYGTITGADGTAIRVNRSGNEVTLGTGSVINGDIRANYNYSDNYMILDGEGTIRANQMQQFGYLNKTGAGTWTLTGDMDYSSSYNYYGHSITVEEGVLALGESSGISGGVVTDSFTQNTGAKIGYAVTAMGSTGRLTVNQNADFGDGSILVIPAAGTYAANTVYPTVLYVNGNITVNGVVVADPTDPSWAIVTSTAAFLRPSLLYNAGVYDLGLERLSFTTATTPGTASLGAALDGMYDTATGDLRTALDELILVSPGDAEAALAGIGGGSYPALQFLSFNGLGKYLGVLNNHIGTGGAFAGNNQGSGMAWYGNGMQLAMAGGGNSMSDAAPLLLAAAGNAGQVQVATGNNWGIWIDGYASYGNRRSDEIISKYKQTLFGGMMGLDVRVAENLFLGISGGISNTELKFDELQDNGRMDSYHGSAYLCYNGKPWYAEGVFTYAYNKYDMDRFINIGPIHEIANGDFKGNEFNGYAEVGYKLNAGGVIIRPLAAFQVDYLTQDSFTETGASLNLEIDKQSIGSYQSFLGLNISGPIKLGASAVLTPELRLKWAHEFSNDDHLINARFAGGGSDYFTVEAEQMSRDTAIAGLGMNLRFNKHLAAYIQYDAELNRDFINHTGLVGLRLEF